MVKKNLGVVSEGAKTIESKYLKNIFEVSNKNRSRSGYEYVCLFKGKKLTKFKVSDM